jgi:hypothetical protein
VAQLSNIYKIKLNKKDNAQEVSEKLSMLAAEKILTMLMIY